MSAIKNFYNKLSKKQKIIIAILIAVIICLSFIKTYFPGSGLSSWRTDLNLVNSDGKNNPAFEQDLTVYFFDVGQGDCSLIKTKEKNVLIDAGNSTDSEKICKYILDSGVETVDYLFLTHPHSDHIGAASDIIDRFEVKNIVIPLIPQSLEPSDPIYFSLMKKIKERIIPLYVTSPDEKYSLGEAQLTVLGPIRESDSLNNMSLVLRLDYGETSFLFTGDCENEEELSLLNNSSQLKCDVLKIGHHGSESSTSELFLSKVKPSVAVISCGLYNSYGHPDEITLKRLSKYNVSCLRTDRNGNIVIGSDKQKLYCWFEKGKRS